MGDDPPVLHCPCRTPVDHNAPLDDQVGLLPGGRIVSLFLGQVRSQVRLQVVVDQ